MVKVEFTPDELGQKHYEICYQGIALNQRSIPASDWDDVIDLVRKLKSIGQPAKTKIGNTEVYDLDATGGVIELEKGELKQLVSFVGQPIWRPLVLEDVRETKVWLEKLGG